MNNIVDMNAIKQLRAIKPEASDFEYGGWHGQQFGCGCDLLTLAKLVLLHRSEWEKVREDQKGRLAMWLDAFLGDDPLDEGEDGYSDEYVLGFVEEAVAWWEGRTASVKVIDDDNPDELLKLSAELAKKAMLRAAVDARLMGLSDGQKIAAQTGARNA